jgi:head-tail adaptor
MGKPMFPIRDFDQMVRFEGEDKHPRNALNEAVGGWRAVFSAWARVRSVRQTDDTAADTPLATASYIFTLRACCHKPAEVAKMRVVWGGDTYYVVGEPLWLDGRRYLQVRVISQKVNDV